MFAVAACVSLVACNNDNGSAFVGVWKTDDVSAPTMIVTKLDENYRLQAKFTPQWSTMDVDMKLKSEGTHQLVTIDGQKRILEINENGEITSYLYGTPKRFSKTN